MKVDFKSLSNSKNCNNIRFEGYKPTKSEHGFKEFEFNFPFDDEKFDCYVEIFYVDQDDNGNYFVIGETNNYGDIKPIQRISTSLSDPNNNECGIKLNVNKPTKINLTREFGISENEAFAYHYKLCPKGTLKDPLFVIDSGNIINYVTKDKEFNKYNIVTSNQATCTKGGAMKLIVPDINNVAWVYNNTGEIVPNPNIETLRKTPKNFANKIGGSLAGIEKDLEMGELDNFTRIVTLPLFTDDSLSAHGYWNKNCNQIVQSLGNINDYTRIQKKLFAKGINLVSDGAYVNEGLEGVHFKHVLQWGEKSPYFNWFNISGLKDSPLSLGVFGKNTENVTHRLVNSPYEFTQDANGIIKIKANKQNYNPKKPTYIQIYDKRLVNAENLSDKELIKAYNKMCENHLDINNHNDTVIPYSFVINPETYKKNVENLNEYNKKLSAINRVQLKDGQGTRIVTQFEYFGLDGKHESGFETWDANPDIAKLNFVTSHAVTQNLKNILDIEERTKLKNLLERKNYETQDYAICSAKFWTKKTNDILNLHVAQQLKNIDGKDATEIYKIIKNNSNGKVFPKNLDVTENIVSNVLKGKYKLNGAKSKDSYNETILKGLMDVPLDSIELGDDIVSVLASPIITKRAASEKQLGKSRFEMYQEHNPHVDPKYRNIYENVDKMYEKEMSYLAKEVFKILTEFKLPAENRLYDEHGNATAYGKYVIPHLTAEIAKFAIIKSVAPKAEFSYNKETGEISYDYNALKQTSLLDMGIIASSPEDEARQLISKIRSGIKNISPNDKEKLTSALLKSIKGTNVESFKLAEMIVNRSEAGLDWRIDATKDIADIESLRNQKTDFEFSWNKVINFWKNFTATIRQYHPDAYIAAEVTDIDNLHGRGSGYKSGSRFSSGPESEKKLMNEAGFTTVANYSYLATGINKIFGKIFENDHGTEKGLDHEETVMKQLVSFLTTGSLESIIYSYTFAGNHDKCRALEGYAIDTEMVYTDLTEPVNNDHRIRAYKILHAMPFGKEPSNEQIANYDFTRISPLNIAKCEAIASGMGKAKNECGLSYEKQENVYKRMLEALANISNGNHKGKIFEAEGLGSKDFNIALDIILDEMDYIENDPHKKLTSSERLSLKNKTFEKIVDPAISKLLGQLKYLVALTGNPTLFAGDEYGATGFEHTTKNITVANRNIIHEEWIDKEHPEYKEFIHKHKNEIDEVFSLRSKPELKALNDGAPFVLDLQKAKTDDGKDIKVSSILRQSPDGSMAVSIFNPTGLTHKFDEYYSPKAITLKNGISLNQNGESLGLARGLRQGMKFVNAKDPNDTYYVRHEDDGYKIMRRDNSKNHDEPIRFYDSTLILYHQPSFKGRKTMYNPQYNFVSQPYTSKEKANIGSKLQLISK